MNKKRLILYLFASILIFEAVYIYSTPNVKANGTIPANYSQTLLVNTTYTYNVTEFDSKFTWLDLNYVGKANLTTNPGGVINVSFVGFHNKPSGVFSPSCFDDPIAHINISFFENITNTLVLNDTLSNVSNSEGGLSLAIGYNAFHSAFVIQTKNLTQINDLAAEQVKATGTMPGTVTITDYDSMIKFEFLQTNKNQNSTMIYDRTTGVLVYSKVQSAFGPDLVINMTSYNFNYTITPNDPDPPPNDPIIPGIPLIALIGIVSLAVIILTLKEKKKHK